MSIQMFIVRFYFCQLGLVARRYRIDIAHIGRMTADAVRVLTTQHLVGVYLLVAASHRELTGEYHTDARADDASVPIGKPLVERPTEGRHAGVDGKHQSADAAGDDHQPIEEAWHLLVPALFQFVACLLNLLSHSLT